MSSGLPKTNPASGREEELNPGPPDYKSSALTTRPRRLLNFPRIPGLRLTALLGSFLVFRILLCIMAVACKSFSDISVTSLVIFCFPFRSWMTVLKGSQFPFSVTEDQNCHPQSHLPYLFWHLSFPSSPLPGVLRVPLRPFRHGSLLLVSPLHLLPNHQNVGLLNGSPL